MLALAHKGFGEPPGTAFRQGDATALEETGERFDACVYAITEPPHDPH
jgi:hypothetical protein